MRIIDLVFSAAGTLKGNLLRTSLLLFAISIGVSSVVILTSVGEGARRYVLSEFASLGTNLLIVLPGRSETTGNMPASFFGETPRDLTIQDSLALLRHHSVKRVAPLIVGEAPVSWMGRVRETPVLGSTSDLITIRHWKMTMGSCHFPSDPEIASPVCVLGKKIKHELFGEKNAIGELLRVGDRRFRVTGILATEGRSIGLDVEELVIIPVASAQMLFNTSSLFRILVEARSRESIPSTQKYIIETMERRHQGEKDVTVITQDAVLSTFDKILVTLTMSVVGIAGISLTVAGILVMNVMYISVSQRTVEIGIMKSLGARRAQILLLLLVEAGALSLLGAGFGIVFGEAGVLLIGKIFPVLPVEASFWAEVLSIAVAVTIGTAFAILPAYRASRLDPVQALRGK